MVWARSPESEPHRMACDRSSDTAPALRELDTLRLQRCLIPRFGAGQGSDVSCCTFCSKVAVQLAEESVLVLHRPIGQVVDELLHLLPVSVFQCLGAAEVDGVGLDQNRIELVLTDQLAEPVAELGFCFPAIP